MSDENDEAPRSVRRHARSMANAEMSAVGYAMALGLLVLLLPVLPFLAVIWLVTRLTS